MGGGVGDAALNYFKYRCQALLLAVIHNNTHSPEFGAQTGRSKDRRGSTISCPMPYSELTELCLDNVTIREHSGFLLDLKPNTRRIYPVSLVRITCK